MSTTTPNDGERPLRVAAPSISPDFATSFTMVANALTPVCRPLPGRLLGIWAHPDDEAYLSAAFMGRVIDHGGEVTVVTATYGEQGTADTELFATSEFAAHRHSELEASLAELGVDDLRMLGIPDGGCATAEPPVDDLVAVLDEVQPDMIVTFGPDGITWHPDHMAVSRWVTDAWTRWDGDGELLYATTSRDNARIYRDLHDRLGLFTDFGPGHAATTGPAGIALELQPFGEELARKRRALGCHASQTDGLAAMLGEEIYQAWSADETFRRPTRTELAASRARNAEGHVLIGVQR